MPHRMRARRVTTLLIAVGLAFGLTGLILSRSVQIPSLSPQTHENTRGGRTEPNNRWARILAQIRREGVQSVDEFLKSNAAVSPYPADEPRGDTAYVRHPALLADLILDPLYGETRRLFVAAELDPNKTTAIGTLEELANRASTKVRHRALLEIGRIALRRGGPRDLDLASAALARAAATAVDNELLRADEYFLAGIVEERRVELSRALGRVRTAINADPDYLAAHRLFLRLVILDARKTPYSPPLRQLLEDVTGSLEKLRLYRDVSILADIRGELMLGGSAHPLTRFVLGYTAVLGQDTALAIEALDQVVGACKNDARRCGEDLIRRTNDLRKALADAPRAR